MVALFRAIRIQLWKNFKVWKKRRTQALLQVLSPITMVFFIVFLIKITPQTRSSIPAVLNNFRKFSGRSGEVLANFAKASPCYANLNFTGTPRQPPFIGVAPRQEGERFRAFINTFTFAPPANAFIHVFDTVEEATAAWQGYFNRVRDRVTFRITNATALDFNRTSTICKLIVFENDFVNKTQFTTDIRYPTNTTNPIRVDTRGNYDYQTSLRFGEALFWYEKNGFLAASMLVDLFIYEQKYRHCLEAVVHGLPYNQSICGDFKDKHAVEAYEGMLHLLQRWYAGNVRPFLYQGDISVVAFPTDPKPVISLAFSILPFLLPILVLLVVLISLTGLLTLLLYEKKEGLKDSLLFVGATPLSYTLSWYIFYGSLGLGNACFITASFYFGGVFMNVNPFLFFFVLLFFFMACYAYALFFIQIAWNLPASQSICIGFLFLGQFLMYILSNTSLFALKLLLLLFFPSIPFGIFSSLISSLSSTWRTLSWETLQYSFNGISLQIALAVLVMHSFLFFSLMIIINTRDWVFLPRQLYNLFNKKEDNEIASTHEEDYIEIKNLSKNYISSRTVIPALQDVSFKIFQGETLSLLGENGSGKSTLVKHLSGELSPTSGELHIFGLNFKENINAIRSMIGICPQTDISWQELTVYEHLQLFTALKMETWNSTQIEKQIAKSLQNLELMEKKFCLPKSLSGGIKRKLTVAIALVGNPKFLLLDEPSSSLDPFAREDLLNWLQNLKDKRTLLVTTHYMEEAEILADRVIILHQGKMKAEGAVLDLKATFASDYTFIIQRGLNSTFPSEYFIQEFLTQFPTLSLHLQTSQKFIFNFTKSADTGLLRVIAFLKKHQNENNFIASFDVRSSTLDDVFTRVVLEDKVSPQLIEKNQNYKEEEEKENATEDDGEAAATFRKLIFQTEQFNSKLRWFYPLQALFLKRLWRLRSLKIFLFDFGIALFIFLLLVVLSTLFYDTLLGFPSLPLTTKAIENNFLLPRGQQDVLPIGLPPDVRTPPPFLSSSSPLWKTLHRVNSTHIPSDLRRLFPFTPKGLFGELYYNFSLAVFDFSRTHPNTKFVGGFLFTPKTDVFPAPLINLDPKMDVLVFGNRTALHALPVHLSVLINELIKQKGLAEYTSTLQNTPLLLPVQSASFSVHFMYILALAYLFIFSALPLLKALSEEKKAELNYAQWLCGVHPVTYWCMHFVYDFLFNLIPCCFGVFLFQAIARRTTENYSPAFTLPLYTVAIASAFCLPWLGYALTFVSDDPPRVEGFFSAVLAHGLYTALLAWGVGMIQTVQGVSFLAVLRFIFHLLGVLNPIYNLLAFLLHLAPSPITLLRPGEATPPALLPPLRVFGRWMLIDATLYITLVLSLDLWKVYGPALRKAWARRPATSSSLCPATSAWPPPLGYTRLTASTASQKAAVAVALSLKGEHLGKTYRSTFWTKKPTEMAGGAATPPFLPTVPAHPPRRVVALQDVHFEIPPGTITSFIGPNGAGKSTLLNIISGFLPPSEGNVRLGETQGLDCQPFAYRKAIANCPQRNILWETFTPLEHMVLFAMLRGCANTKELKQQCKAQLRFLGMERYANFTTNALSGGSKRKLCALLSILQKQPLSLMDEPTNGLDPLARKKFSRFILAWFRSSDPPPINIISTHAIEEAEEIADRLMVIYASKILFLGTIPELKEKYKEMYRLVVKFNKPTLEELTHHKRTLDLETRELVGFYELNNFVEEQPFFTHRPRPSPSDQKLLNEEWKKLFVSESQHITVERFVHWWCVFFNSQRFVSVLRQKLRSYEIFQQDMQLQFFKIMITSETKVDLYEMFKIFEDTNFLMANHVEEYSLSTARIQDYINIIQNQAE